MRFALDVLGKNGHRVKSGLEGGKLGLSGESIRTQERPDATKMGGIRHSWGAFTKGQCWLAASNETFFRGKY